MMGAKPCPPGFGHCDHCGADGARCNFDGAHRRNQNAPRVASIPDSRTGRMSNKAYNRAVVERAYRDPPTGNAKRLYDMMARAVGMEP